MEIKTKTEKETKRVGKKLAENILNKKKDKKVVVALRGNLGAGKTVFTKGFAEKFDVLEITSPTFVIMKSYEVNKGNFNRLFHIDCYRLEKKSDLKEINFEDILETEGNIIIVEWPDKLTNLPEDIVSVEFDILPENKRKIRIFGNSGLNK